MGCGRVGARLATELDEAGHSVAVIDKRSDAFERLEDSYSGQRVTGSGLDRTVLIRAGIEEAYAFAAVSDGDNSNIIAARTVSEVYQVNRVVARIYDPERAELYERLGIPTVAAVMRTSAAILKRMLPPSTSLVWEDSTGSVSLSVIRPAPQWIGESIDSLERQTHCRVAFISRLAGVVVAAPGMAVQEHDELFIAIEGNDPGAIRRALSAPPRGATK